MAPAPFPVVIDANVLFSFVLRDTILRAAEVGLCQPYWSADILDEVERNLVESDKAPVEGAARLRALMEEAFPGALVEGYYDLVEGLENEVKDRHVVAAALAVGAPVIVTSNLRHFAPLPEDVGAVSPDELLCELFRRDPEAMIWVLRQQVADFKRPPVTYEELLDHLANIAPSFVRTLRKF